MKERFLLKFSYDGTLFCGYQRQPLKRTVQACMEEALEKINNQKTSFVATGRTDKGVHALVQYGHCDLEVKIQPQQLKRAMNRYLPEDIYVMEVKTVDSNFHARYYAYQKEYQYHLNMGAYQPLQRNYVYQHNYPLNVEKMEEAIHFFEGEHDFRAFVTENKEKENCCRTISFVSLTYDEKDKNKIIFTFRGNGFMRYQVRNMVGLLLKVGTGKIEANRVKEILESKARNKDGAKAPSQGLYLVNVWLR